VTSTKECAKTRILNFNLQSLGCRQHEAESRADIRTHQLQCRLLVCVCQLQCHRLSLLLRGRREGIFSQGRAIVDFPRCWPNVFSQGETDDRAGLIKCRARLEALLRGPTQWLVVQKFLKSASNNNHRSQKERDPKRIMPS